MHILTFADHVELAVSPERTQIATCRALAERGHRIDAVRVVPADLDGWEGVAAPVAQVADTTRPRIPFAKPHRAFERAQGIGHLEADVIYVFHYLHLPLAVAVGRLSHAPVVLHLCLPRPDRLAAVVRRSLPRVAMTLAASFDVASRWRDSGLGAESVIVVHTGVDSDHHVPMPPATRQTTRRTLGLEPDAFVALYSGRIGPDEGLEVLMEAARLLTGTHAGFRLVMEGGPPAGADAAEASRYRAELCARAGPTDIRWLDRWDDPVPLYGVSDVTVVPSTLPEPFTRSAIESLACGVPAVATDVGGNPEILVDPLERLLVPPGDAPALAERIGSLIDWRTDEPELGARCRAVTTRRLSLVRMIDTVEAALASVARHRSDDLEGSD